MSPRFILSVFCASLYLALPSMGNAQKAYAITTPSQEACHSKDSTIEIEACDSLRYQNADKHLNAIYSVAMKNLDSDKKLKLQESQRAWIKFRDANFALVLSLNSDAGTYGGIVYGDFKANLVTSRVIELINIFVEPSGDMPTWWPPSAPTWRQKSR